MRVLLVEDETRLAEALAYILKKNKYAVDLAFNGISGEELAETGIYDLIILDRMLPGKEGVAVLESLRARGIKTPVLMLTPGTPCRTGLRGSMPELTITL